MAVTLGGNFNSIATVADNSQFGTNWPVTMASWSYGTRANVRVDNGTANKIHMGGQNATVAPSGAIHTAYVDDDFDAGHAAVIVSGTVTGWHHYAARYDSNTSRTAFFDGGTLGGGQQATNTAAVALSLSTPDIGLYGSGPMAEVAMWKAALTNEEIAFLAAGGKPHQLTNHTSNLVFYMPLRINGFDDQLKNLTNLSQSPVNIGMPKFPYE